LRDSAHILMTYWNFLFNTCLETGNIPDDWKLSMLKVLYKGKGEMTDPNAYRGIALESTIFKLFTKCVAKRVYAHVEHLIPEEQYRFQKQKSTIQPLKLLV